MRNKYSGLCYRCGEIVEKGQGHFEKNAKPPAKWKLQHASCCLKAKHEPKLNQKELQERKPWK